MVPVMRPDPGWSRRLALAVVLLVLLAPAGLAQDQASPAPSGSMDPVDPPLAWTRGRVPEALAGTSFADVVAGGPGFIAVGGGWVDGSAGPTAEIRISETGRTWIDVPLSGAAAVGQIRAITATTEGYVAVGGRCCPDQAVVWTSADGLVWEMTPDLPVLADAAMFDVTVMPDGALVAVGCSAVMECMGGLAWRAPAGGAWEPPVPLPFIPSAVVAGPAGVIAVGTTEPYDGAPAAATSGDGVTWTTGDLDVPAGSLLTVVGDAGGAVLAGSERDPAAFTQAGLLVATDGTTWETLPDGAIPGATFADALRLDATGTNAAGMLLAGWVADDQGGRTPATWWSADGRSWVPGAFPPEMKGDAAVVAVAVGPDGTVVAVGEMVLNRGSVPATWRSVPGRR